jgi:hypothetical protein
MIVKLHARHEDDSLCKQPQCMNNETPHAFILAVADHCTYGNGEEEQVYMSDS